MLAQLSKKYLKKYHLVFKINMLIDIRTKIKSTK